MYEINFKAITEKSQFWLGKKSQLISGGQLKFCQDIFFKSSKTSGIYQVNVWFKIHTFFFFLHGFTNLYAKKILLETI